MTKLKQIETGKVYINFPSKDEIMGFYGGIVVPTYNKEVVFITESYGELTFEFITEQFEFLTD